MNWFLKLIGGEDLITKAVERAKEEWRQELKATDSGKDTDSIDQAEKNAVFILDVITKQGHTISSNSADIQSNGTQIEGLWSGWTQHLNTIGRLEKVLDQQSVDTAVGIASAIEPIRKRLDALEDATTDSDRVDPTTTDAD